RRHAARRRRAGAGVRVGGDRDAGPGRGGADGARPADDRVGGARPGGPGGERPAGLALPGARGDLRAGGRVRGGGRRGRGRGVHRLGGDADGGPGARDARRARPPARLSGSAFERVTCLLERVSLRARTAWRGTWTAPRSARRPGRWRPWFARRRTGGP